MRIAPVGNRTGPSDNNHARTCAESRFQRNLHVAHYFDFRRNNLRYHLAQSAGNLLTPNAGNSRASTLHLPKINACRYA
jgi:hypothetical protein